MKFSVKHHSIAVIIFLLLNLILFFYRNKGFDYSKYANKEELYPHSVDKRFIQKWSETKQLSSDEIIQGLNILKREIGVDTISSQLDKVIHIGAWLQRKLSNNPRGVPPDTLLKLYLPIQHYLYLEKHKEAQVWCGNYQTLFGYFASCAGFLIRYVELLPVSKSAGDYHAVNEVFLSDQNRWVIVDITRNMLLTTKDNQTLSAADYYDYKINHPSEAVKASFMLSDSLQQIPVFTDKYFNSKYALRYFKIMDLSRAYKPTSKIKRYFLGDSWYETYDPVRQHSNFLFRIRQLTFLFLIVTVFLFMLKALKII